MAANSFDSLVSIAELVSTPSTKTRVLIFRDEIPKILDNSGQSTDYSLDYISSVQMQFWFYHFYIGWLVVTFLIWSDSLFL